MNKTTVTLGLSKKIKQKKYDEHTLMRKEVKNRQLKNEPVKK